LPAKQFCTPWVNPALPSRTPSPWITSHRPKPLPTDHGIQDRGRFYLLRRHAKMRYCVRANGVVPPDVSSDCACLD
jgi:hypothetical protein